MGDVELANSDNIPRYPLLVDSPSELISKRDHLVLDASYILITEILDDPPDSLLVDATVWARTDSPRYS